MKAIVQRVTSASVEVDGTVVGKIGTGLLVFVGVAKGDGEADCRYLVEKLRTFRIFSDEQGKMNRSLVRYCWFRNLRCWAARRMAAVPASTMRRLRTKRGACMNRWPPICERRELRWKQDSSQRTCGWHW